MKKIYASLFSVAILMTISSHLFAQTIVMLNPSADAGIGFHDNFNSANTNYVTADHYGAFSQPGASGGENAGHGIMQFDLSTIPSGTVITSASLNLYGRGTWGAGAAGSVGNIGQADSYLERITSAWDESLVTWNTAPTITNQNAVLLPAATTAIQDYLNINVTQLVQDMLDNPNSSFGFSLGLVTEDPTRALVFCSNDFSDASKHPLLTITYQCAPATWVLFPVADAGIGFHDYFNSANTNYVTADHYGAFSQPGASGGENAGHGIMQFDLSPIPTGTAITSAKLDLYGRGAWGAGDAGSVGNIGQADSYLERITSAWDENLVTWNTAPTITNQNAILLPAAASAVQDYLNINVTQLVQDMVDNPNSSFGFSLRLVTEDPTRALVFCSSDFTDVSKHPRLTVTICGETGINETSAATHIVNVYPNPAGDYFTINLNHAIVTKPVAEIFDVFGKLVAKQNLNSNETVISRNGWSSGVYFYRIKTGDAILDQGKVVLR